MKILEVNTVAVGGSIPAYLRTIVAEAQRRGHTVAVAKGRRADMPGVQNIQIGTRADVAAHVAATRLADMHGLASRRATRRFIADIENFAPDVIHLHNIHGYYLHYPTLFDWLSSAGIPVLWTLHDTWAFTGHCPYFDYKDTRCERWLQGCGQCPLHTLYPSSIADRSAANLQLKARIFTSIPNLMLLPVSEWLDSCLAQSCLRDVPRQVVKIDVDTTLFRPQGKPAGKRVLGVAANWNPLKGIDFFARLRAILPQDVEIRLLGRPAKGMPVGIDMPGMVHSAADLVREYSAASVFVNPTYADNYPLVNREALACGTPVVSRITGGSVEDIHAAGIPVWACHSDDDMVSAIVKALESNDEERTAARSAAVNLYGNAPNLKKLFSLIEGGMAL